MVNDKSLRLEDCAAQSMTIAEHKEVKLVICQPGDTMIFRPNDAHSVFTVFPEGSPASEQWAMINGQTAFKTRPGGWNEGAPFYKIKA